MVKGQIEEAKTKIQTTHQQGVAKNADVYLTYIINMFSYQQIKLQTIS